MDALLDLSMRAIALSTKLQRPPLAVHQVARTYIVTCDPSGKLFVDTVGLEPSLFFPRSSLGDDPAKQMRVNLPTHPFSVQDVRVRNYVSGEIDSLSAILEDQWEPLIV